MNSSFSFPAAPPPAPPVSNMNQMPASLTPEQQQQLLQQQYESQRQQFLFQQQQQQYQSQQGLEQLTPEQQFLLQQQQQQQQQILQQQYLSQQAQGQGQGQGSFQFPSTPLPSVAPANAQQQQQKEEEEKEVYDALFPAREMLRLQREAELKAKREEEDRLRQLEKMNKANAMPSVPSSSQFNAYSSGLQFPTVITQQPGAYSSQIPASAPPAAPTAASFFTPTPQTSSISSTTNASLSSLNGGVGGQNGMLGGIGGAGGAGLSGAPGSASTASLLDHNVPDAYRNQAVSNGAPRNTDFFASLSRLQGDNSPYNAAGGAGPVSGSLLPSFNGGDQAAGANAEDDLNARIRRLSTMNLQSDAGNIYGSQNPNYYGSQAADMEPPTYSTPNLTYQRFVTQTTTIPGQPGSSDYPIYDVQEVGEGQEEEDDGDDEIYQTVDGERQQGLSSKEWQEQMDQDPNRVVSMEHLRYYSDRTQFKRKNTARQKAAKILIPVATTAGGVVAGAIGGAAIGAAAGGVGAPVGLVIGAVLGGTAGASVGVAATQTAPFRKQIVPVGTYRTSATRCAHCQSLFDLDPFSCQQCRRLFCRNCGVRNDGLMYCVQCSGPRYLPSSGPVEYRRIAY